MFPLKDNEPSGTIPIMTFLIILINTVVMVTNFFSPDPLEFIYSLALIPSQIDYSNLATLSPFISAMFLHGGFLHYFSNMWFLYIFGDNVEGFLGKVSYLFFYLSGGVVASLIELSFLESTPIPILGASGAIAAVLGFYLVRFPKHTVNSILPFFPFFIIKLPSVVILGLWFFSQIFNGVSNLIDAPSITGGVAWWAHIGGFVYGMMIAFLYRIFSPKQQRFLF